MSATLFNTNSHEKSRGFVYRWTYKPTGEYYIGIHKGTIGDGYIGSGRRFKAKYALTDPNDWNREILLQGHYLEECALLEAELVNDDTLSDPLCLNLIVGGKIGYRPQRNFSSKKKCYRTKPQQVTVYGQVYSTRMKAIKDLHISFEELDSILDTAEYNEFNKY